MSHLALFLFGPPRIKINGKPVEMGRRKAVALLAFLAVSGQAHSRDSLATLFWPQQNQSHARAALRRTLSVINTTLGPDCLVTNGETVELNRDSDIESDTETFRRIVAGWRSKSSESDQLHEQSLTELTRAADLYSGDFMAGFTLADCPEFDEWQFFEGEQLRQDVIDVLHQLVVSQMATGNLETAIKFSRRWHNLDQLDERPHQYLMKMYALTGRRTAALRQYQICTDILKQELGIAPSQGLQDLSQLIQSGLSLSPTTESPAVETTPKEKLRRPMPELGSPRTPSAPIAATESVKSNEYPFVAREKELNQLNQILDQARQGNLNIAFVVGESGTGKTALVTEFASRILQDSPQSIVAMGKCNAYTGVGDPYLPFREILCQLVGGLEANQSGGTFTIENSKRLRAAAETFIHSVMDYGPDLLGTFITRSTVADCAIAVPGNAESQVEYFRDLVQKQAQSDKKSLAQTDLFEQLTRVLRNTAEKHELLLIVDDAQWIDAASAGLLFHLSRRLEGSRILLIITYRPDEIGSGRDGDRHPLEMIINEVKRIHGKVWVDLEQAMGRDFVNAIVDAIPNRLEPGFRDALYERTAGHALFTVELLQDMRQRGALAPDDKGNLVEGDVLNWDTLPARVEALVAERIDRLESGLRDILTSASVEGVTFTVQVLAEVHKMDERQILRSLSHLLEKRYNLVREVGEVHLADQRLFRFQFTHTLFQRYLYHSMSAAERRILHRETAEVLETLYRNQTEEIPVQLARHYSEAGDVSKTCDYLLRAGDRARDIYAHQEATGFYLRALELLKGQGDFERAARTHMKLGLTYHQAFDYSQARKSFGEGFSLWQTCRAWQPSIMSAAPHPLRLIWPSPASISPLLVNDDASGTYVDQFFVGLLTLTPDMDVMPELAKSWDMLDGGSKYVFHLRDDTFWSDGHPITAPDFEFAWKTILDPESGCPNADHFFDIRGAAAYNQGRVQSDQVAISCPNDKTLVVELEGPSSYFPQIMAEKVSFAVPRHAVEAHGANWTDPDKIVTSGPFRIENWDSGRSMTMVRNPSYTGTFTGNVQEVTFSLDVETEERFEMYENDCVDVVHFWPMPGADECRQRHIEDYVSGPNLLVQYLGLNVSVPPLDDLRVRQALSFAIDKETLASVVYKGYSFPATGGFVPPGMPGHAPDIGLPFDVEMAQRLLSKAGYPGGKGFPTFPIVSGWRRDGPRQTCEYLARQWEEHLGIHVFWEAEAWTEFLLGLEQVPPPLFLLGWIADYLDPDNALRIGARYPKTGWHNESYSQLVEDARRLTNQGERMQLYRQADKILVDEAAITPLMYGRVHALIKPWISKFVPSTINWTFLKDVVINDH